jgi:hypothetical protein
VFAVQNLQNNGARRSPAVFRVVMIAFQLNRNPAGTGKNFS